MSLGRYHSNYIRHKGIYLNAIFSAVGIRRLYAIKLEFSFNTTFENVHLNVLMSYGITDILYYHGALADGI